MLHLPSPHTPSQRSTHSIERPDNTTSEGAFTHVGVVVPAHNEEELLPACLAALADAASACAVSVTVVVVLDSCTDRSGAAIEAFSASSPNIDLITIEVGFCSVGAARRQGMSELTGRLGMVGTWLATTDADSAVPPHWLNAQLAHAYAGAHVVVGTVAVADWAERDAHLRAQAIADYAATYHGHIHGANLSFSAQAYQRCGGFDPLTYEEDVALVRACESAGLPIAWALDLPVRTSARRVARAPDGFAAYLNRLEQTLGSASFGDTEPAASAGVTLDSVEQPKASACATTSR